MATVKVKYGTEVFELKLDTNEDLYRRLAAMLDLQLDRIKLIRSGKVLPPSGSADLTAALSQPGIILCSGTRRGEHLPGTARRLAASARESLSQLWGALTVSGMRSLAAMLWMWLSDVASSAGRGALSFVSSAVVAPPSRRREERED